MTHDNCGTGEGTPETHGHRWKVAPRELSIPRRVLEGATCNQREREAEPVHRYPRTAAAG